MKNKPFQCGYEDLFRVIEDILIYSKQEEEEKYTTNQCFVGIRYLFRGFIVKT